jgi:biopolymer transport protein ExbB
MFSLLRDQFLDLMQRGGVVMWPLLGLSIVAGMLCFERAWFFVKTNHPGRLGRLGVLTRLLRRGEVQAAGEMIARDSSVYGRTVAAIIEEQGEVAATATPGAAGATEMDPLAMEVVERQRGRLERFMPTLSTIITAAPMLGILGTVTGIISSFHVLSNETATDPRAVSQGIAEALLTTAAGLVVALLVLFPYNAYRAQIDRTLSRLETLAAAALMARKRK